MTSMLVLPNFSWTFVGEADSYRRRPFPLKFLQYECSDFPCYAFESELSKAFNDVGDIKELSVNLDEYRSVIQEKARNIEIKSYDRPESLVTSTKEFIKNILRWIYKTYKKTVIVPKKDCELVLKVDGQREFFMGDY